MSEQFWQQFDQGNFWDNWQEQDVAPSAQRDFRGLKEARAKAHVSGQFDEDQLAEMDGLFAQREQALGLHGTQDKIREPSAAQQIRGSIATIGDRVFTRNPQTGEAVLLADGAQAKQDQEFAKAEHQMKMQEAQTKLLTQQEGAKIKLAQQQAGLTTTNADGTPGKPQYTPEQVRENVDKVFPQGQGMMSTPPEQTGQATPGQGPAKAGQYGMNHPAVQFMPPALQKSVATFQGGTQAEQEAVGNIVGGVRTYWSTKSGSYEVHPGDAIRAKAQLDALEQTRRLHDAEIRYQQRQFEKQQAAQEKQAFNPDVEWRAMVKAEMKKGDDYPKAKAKADAYVKGILESEGGPAPGGQQAPAQAAVVPPVNNAFANQPAGSPEPAPQVNVQMPPQQQGMVKAAPAAAAAPAAPSKLAQESAFQNDHEAEWQQKWDALPPGGKIMGLDGKVYSKPKPGGK